MSCGLLTSARNRVSHPGTQDIDTAEAKTYLYYIGEMLSRTNHPDEKRIVEELSQGMPDPEIAKLEASVGALAVKLNDTIQHLERLDNDADRDRAEIEGLKEQFRSQNQQLATEMVSRIESMTTPQEQPINSESASDSPDKDELERLSSEVENTRRLIVALRSENRELRDKIEDVTKLVVELQLNNAQEIADRVKRTNWKTTNWRKRTRKRTRRTKKTGRTRRTKRTRRKTNQSRRGFGLVRGIIARKKIVTSRMVIGLAPGAPGGTNTKPVSMPTAPATPLRGCADKSEGAEVRWPDLSA